MGLIELIEDFVARPDPLWTSGLTNQLVNEKLKTFTCAYTLTNCILKDATATERSIPLVEGTNPMLIVLPSEELKFFFDDHGIETLPVDSSFKLAVAQIKRSLAIFADIPSMGFFIGKTVSSICILKAEDAETDVSYSHPDIPFSIFLSAGGPKSPQTNLRVAESILHEAMHLFLTLIEGISPIVDKGSMGTYYSPWRDEPRPLRGVIHGLFVFKAILQFYECISEKNMNPVASKFINGRITTIKNEIRMLSDFPKAPGLTPYGRKLALNLCNLGILP